MDIDTDSEVRIVVDKKGLCLNKLINDGLVRVAVAEQGYVDFCICFFIIIFFNDKNTWTNWIFC